MKNQSLHRKRYLLCRPQGGLNDMLCQIEKCCRYAEKTGRTVIIDTNYKNAENFNDEFNLYFRSKQKKLLLSTNEIQDDLTQLTVFPHCLKGKLNDYETAIKIAFEPFKEAVSNTAITFDFTKNYPEELLVHHQGGGGTLSLFSLLRLEITEALVHELIRRIKSIHGAYTAIHVRHTDYLSDYATAIQALAEKPPRRLFVASDNQNVIDELIQKLPSSEIFTFSNLLSTDGQPIHSKRIEDQTLNFKRNCDAIVDLITLAISSNLILCKITTGLLPNKKPTYSGFSLLAKQLNENKTILSHVLGLSRIKIGLD